MLDDRGLVPESVAVIEECGVVMRVQWPDCLPDTRRLRETLMINLAPARRERHTVLLVDDDAALADVLKEYLTDERFEVIHAHDSMAALALLETRQDIDLLLADIALHAGTPHGISLALMARRLVPGIRIALMTGHPDLLEVAGDLPGKAFVKPVDLAELTQELRGLLAD
jgi:DNA-binding NtrC family response regulator